MASLHDTIAAIATPPGVGGLAVVRISGPRAFAVLAKLWRSKTAAENFEPRKLYYGTILTNKSQAITGQRMTSNSLALIGQPEMIDRVLAAKMPAPATYTGDDVVEISSHGSPVVVQQILAACLAAGSRLAAPGEFTKRAFLSGKLDLIQAEAVADLIHASSEQGARSAQQQLAGRLSAEVKELHDKLIELRAFVEAAIDFPEEDIEMMESQGIAALLMAIETQIDRLRSTYAEGRIIRDGVRVAIVGKPNVGKSSLLNALAGAPRAIVHATPGTTRDMIEVTVAIDGCSFLLWDTAGLRQDAGEIEGIGIARTRQAMEQADLLLVVVDGSVPLTEEDQRLLAETAPVRRLVCINKSDLTPVSGTDRRAACPPGTVPLGEPSPLLISARTGDGLDDLKRAIKAAAMPAMLAESGSAMVTNLRHKEALDDSAGALVAARASLERRESAEFCAHHLRVAQEALGRIIGLDVTEAVLDGIFSKFCVGK